MGKKKHRSGAVKKEVVLRLLKGEDLQLVSRETGLALHELTGWRERYLRSGREALKSHPGDALTKNAGPNLLRTPLGLGGQDAVIGVEKACLLWGDNSMHNCSKYLLYKS